MSINYYNPYVRRELELYHHGILGQRWGKKNGPPYPLGASDHSASEKRAGWRKSLAGGAKAFGRGVVKGSKLAWKGTKAAARGTNKALLRMNLKPKKLMSDQEIIDQIGRLRQEKAYKNALKGRFGDVTQYEKKKGEGALSKLMSGVGNQVLLPMIINGINYSIASKVAQATGDKAPSMVESIFGKSVRFRDGERYMSDSVQKRLYDDDNGRNHLILDTRKKDSGQGDGEKKGKKGKKDNENDGGNSYDQQSKAKKEKPSRQESYDDQEQAPKSKPKEEKRQDSPQPKPKEEKQQQQDTQQSKSKEQKPVERDPWLEEQRRNATVPPEYQKKESLSSKTQSLGKRTEELFKQGSATEILKPVRAQQKAEADRQKEIASIWATVPKVKTTMSSPPVKKTLQTKMKYFNSFANKNRRFRAHDFEQVYQTRMDDLSTGDLSYAEYIKRLSRI